MSYARFKLEIPDCDLADATYCRSRALEVIRDPAFEELLANLQVTRDASLQGPAPRSRGEAKVTAEAKSGGDWSVKGEVSIKF